MPPNVQLLMLLLPVKYVEYMFFYQGICISRTSTLLLTPGSNPDFLHHPLHWPSICIFSPQPLICVSCLQPLISTSGSGLGLQFDFTGHESLLFYLLIYLFQLVKRILLTSFEMCIDILRKCFRLNYFWITFLGILETTVFLFFPLKRIFKD